jgi:hypothetical protein
MMRSFNEIHTVPEKDTKRQCYPLNNNPGKETIEIQLIRRGIHLKFNQKYTLG